MIQVNHKSGKSLNLEIDERGHAMIFKLFGSLAKPVVAKNKQCILISYASKEFKAGIKKLFGATIKGDTYIELTPESFEKLIKLQNDFKVKRDAELAELEILKSKQPTYYSMYQFLDWGDYVINNEKEIRLMRKALPTESSDSIVESYKFWNNDIDNYIDEWNVDSKIIPADKNSIEISNELAEKWINIHSEIIYTRLAKEKDEAKKKTEIELKRKEERQAKFDLAKSTGKPVLIHKYVTDESNLPKHLQEDESDVVHVYVYAQPDGSTKEEISHCY